MRVIINILLDCQLRKYLWVKQKWITTSKRSWLPKGREWKICSNMKVAKWVEAPTGMFIKPSAKMGKKKKQRERKNTPTVFLLRVFQSVYRACGWFVYIHMFIYLCTHVCVCVCVFLSSGCQCFCFHIHTHTRSSSSPLQNTTDGSRADVHF